VNQSGNFWIHSRNVLYVWLYVLRVHFLARKVSYLFLPLKHQGVHYVCFVFLGLSVTHACPQLSFISLISKGEGKVVPVLLFNWAPRHEGVLGEWRSPYNTNFLDKIPGIFSCFFLVYLLSLPCLAFRLLELSVVFHFLLLFASLFPDIFVHFVSSSYVCEAPDQNSWELHSSTCVQKERYKVTKTVIMRYCLYIYKEALYQFKFLMIFVFLLILFYFYSSYPSSYSFRPPLSFTIFRLSFLTYIQRSKCNNIFWFFTVWEPQYDSILSNRFLSTVWKYTAHWITPFHPCPFQKPVLHQITSNNGS